MNLQLVCVACHPAIPSFAPGVPAALTDTGFTMPATTTLRRRLAQALRDGALVLGPDGPTWAEIEAEVERETAAFHAYLDAVEARVHAKLAS